MRMPLVRFTVLTFVGTIPWCFGIAGAGWALGNSWDRFHHDFRWVEYAVVAAILGAVLYLILRRRSSTLARRAGSSR
jgi:membrane protein DedA with SNARE-associated domain